MLKKRTTHASDHFIVGCTMMWVATIFLLFVSASSSRASVDKEIQAIVGSLFAPDLFHRFLIAHPPNSSISPCDNFYRHVCPVELPEEHAFTKILEKQTTILESLQDLNFQQDFDYATLSAFSADMVEKFWASMRHLNQSTASFDVAQTSKEIHDRCQNHGGNTCILRIIGKIVPIANTGIGRYPMHQLANATTALNRLYTKFNTTEDLSSDALLRVTVEVMKIFYDPIMFLDRDEKMLNNTMKRIAFLSFMRRGDMLNEMFARQAERISAEIREEMARDAMRYSWSSDESRFGVMAGALIGIHLRNAVIDILPMDRYEVQYDHIRPWKEFVNSLHFADQIIGTPDAYVNRMALYITALSRVTTEDLVRDNYVSKVDAKSSDENLILFAHAFLLRLLHNVPDAIKFGSFYYLYAHEAQHQVQHVLRSKSENEKLHENRTKCLTTYMQDMCHTSLFKEETCNSGEITYTEDDADQVGERIALRLFRKYHHATLQDKLYPDVNFTNEQLFFAAQAILWCSGFKTSQHSFDRGLWEVHSAVHVRPNAAYAIMNEFREAFKCPPDSKMVQQIPFFVEREDYGRYSEIPIDACNPEISGWNYVRPEVPS